MSEGPPKNKVRERLFKLKHQFHASGDMRSLLADLHWFLDLRKKGGSNQSDLWELMSKNYSEFNDDELEELILQLEAD